MAFGPCSLADPEDKAPETRRINTNVKVSNTDPRLPSADCVAIERLKNGTTKKGNYGS